MEGVGGRDGWSGLSGTRHRRCRTVAAASSESECPTRDAAPDVTMCHTVRAFRSVRPRSARTRTSRARCRTRHFLAFCTAPTSLPRQRSVMRHPSFLAIGAFCALALLGAIDADAQPARAERADLPPNTIALTDLRGFRPTSANWRIVGDATADRTRPLALVAEPGTGVLVNSPTDAAKGQLLTTWEHGDLDLSLDIMLPKASNSGVYLMGRYEVQLFDSWGVRTPTFADMGGIYQRWDESRGAGHEGYEGTPPALNASRAPGLWQHLEIAFRAPRFE